MPRYLFALDLDGTLLDNKGRLSLANQQVLHRLREEGHLVTFVSGRTEIDMMGCKNLLCEADYILLNSGGKLIETKAMEVIFDTVIPQESARILVDFCLLEGIRLYIIMGCQFACTENGPEVQRYALEVGAHPRIINSFDDLQDLPIEAFVAIGGRSKLDAFIEREKLPLNCLGSEPEITDIVPKDVDKWRGICQMRDNLVLSIPVVSVGNYHNDRHMIEGAEIGVAVSNAPREIKELADLVLESDNNQDIMLEIEEKLKVNFKLQ